MTAERLADPATIDTYAAPMPSRRAPTRERILDVALELFMERGVSGTTVMEIERVAGLASGSGSFYRHFRSKEELVIPAFQRGLAQVVQQLAAARAGDTELDEPHDETSADYHSLLRDMRTIHPLWLFLLSERDRFPELQDVFIDTLGMRQWDLRWDQDRVRTIAIAALAGFHELAMLDEAYYGTIDAGEFVAALAELTEFADAMLPSSIRR
jgi:AcrR family transcriptional regulator